MNKITIELTDEELKTVKEHLLFRMEWIQAGMDEKEPLDFILAKILKAQETNEFSDDAS